MKKVFALFLVMLISQAVFAYNGDVNGDGTVTSADVTAIYNFILNGDETALINGDVNGDGAITSADVTVIYNILLGTPADVTVFVVNGVTFKMVQVDGGSFMMGASNSYLDERPVHQVTLSSFKIGQTEVTQELWMAVMGNNPSYFNEYGNSDYGSYHSSENYGTNLQRPVEWVSWNDCQEFISNLNQITGKNFRLLTEAEWEYAARGGNNSQGFLYAGSNTLVDVAWYVSTIPSIEHGTVGYGTQTVATKLPNELGLYDMTGNVREWCHDWYNSNYYSESPSTNPQGPDSGTYRVLRGGCWANYQKQDLYLSRRFIESFNHLDYGIGLRLAL